MTTVLIADPAPLWRNAVRRALEQLEDVVIVAEAGDAPTLVNLAARHHPDVVILDIDLKRLVVADTIRALRASTDQIKILIFTSRDDPRLAQRSLNEGAAGYVLKTIDGAALQEVFRILRMNERVVDRELEARIGRLKAANSAEPASGSNPFTDRELQLLQWLADGSGNAEIAKRLGVSERTAKGYLGEVFEKLGARTRLEAVVNAVRLDLLRL